MAERPRNILFIWTDQQRPDTIGAYGNPRIHSPNLNRLANGSALFESAYCAQPVCSPARGSVLTGVFPHSHGVTENSTPLSPAIPTLAELLKPAGYRCGYVGKWHLGRERTPQRGFEDFWSSTEAYGGGYAPDDPGRTQLSSYDEYLLSRGHTPSTSGKGFSRLEATRMPEADSKPSFQAGECIRFLDAHRDQPFLLMVNFLEPHPPVFGPLDDLYRPDEMVLPPTWYQEMEGTVPLRVRLRRDPAHSPGHWSSLTSRDEQGWKAYKARYWGLATLVDRHAGRILDHLDGLGLARDTIVVFSSDHGDMMGEHRLLNKGLPYDGSARVPLLIRVPDLEPRRLDTPVSQVAIVPTLLELLGQPAPGHVQEASLVPLLVRGDVDPDRGEAVLEWTGYDGFPASYKEPAVPGFTDEDSARLHRVDYRTIRRGRWKLTVHESGEHELYDLEADPGEAHNAFHDAGARPTVEHLGARLRSWQERTADPLALPAL